MSEQSIDLTITASAFPERKKKAWSLSLGTTFQRGNSQDDSPAPRTHFPQDAADGKLGRLAGKRGCSRLRGRPPRRSVATRAHGERGRSHTQRPVPPRPFCGLSQRDPRRPPSWRPGSGRRWLRGRLALGVSNRQRRPHCPTSFGFCCFLSCSKKAFLQRQRRHVPGNWRCGEEGRQPLGSWGLDSWLWDLRSLQKARESSVEMNGQPLTGMLWAGQLQTDLARFLRAKRTEPHSQVMGQQALACLLELALALKKKKNHHLPFFFFLVFLESSEPQGQPLLLGLCPEPLLSSRATGQQHCWRSASTADRGRRESYCRACRSRASGTDRPAPQVQACVAQPPIWVILDPWLFLWDSELDVLSLSSVSSVTWGPGSGG